MKELELKIEGMMCQHCKKNVENILSELKGLESFELSLEDGKAKLMFSHDLLDRSNIIKAFEGSSYIVS